MCIVKEEIKMKRTILITIALVLLFTVAASAATLAVRPSVTLTFSGTTANCTGSVSDPGHYINATLELIQGGTVVGSWPVVGTSGAANSGTANCVSGLSYTLKLSGTSGGVSFIPASITKTCP